MSLRFDITFPVGPRRLRVALCVDRPVCLIGPNGSGKSSLLRALIGVLPGTVGTIHLGERVLQNEVQFLPTRERHLGWLPQNAVWPLGTALEQVQKAMQFAHLPADPLLARQWLSRLAAEHLADRPARLLSAGEAQRVTLARTLAAQPAALLLDEPTSNQDPQVKLEVRLLLRALVAELQIPLLLVTHDLDDAQALDADVAVLENDPVVEQFPLAVLQNRQNSPFVSSWLRLPLPEVSR